MNVLVTGGGGFLGSHVVRALIKRGDSVTVYDNYVTANTTNLRDVEGRFKLIKGDILDLSHLLRVK